MLNLWNTKKVTRCSGRRLIHRILRNLKTETMECYEMHSVTLRHLVYAYVRSALSSFRIISFRFFNGRVNQRFDVLLRFNEGLRLLLMPS